MSSKVLNEVLNRLTFGHKSYITKQG